MEESRRTKNGIEAYSPVGHDGPMIPRSDVDSKIVPEHAIQSEAEPVHIVEFESDNGAEPVGTALVEAVAAVRDIPPTALVDRLSDRIDPDALERLFDPTDSTPGVSGWLTFAFAGTWVTVTDDREVRVYDPMMSEEHKMA